MSLITRLAPSPTGGLHLGHARTFLAAWLLARREGGRVLLRIEDLDSSRVRPGAAEEALVDLRWLGLDWDEGPDVGGPHGPYIQSQRLDRYDQAIARLKQLELIYPCTCTRADIARAASAPHADEEGPTYPGTCAHRRSADAGQLQGRPFAWRIRVPPGDVSWRDLHAGHTSIDPSRVGGDFIVAREGVGPSYQLAVVVDDAAMGVTCVLRGDDLLPSTPRQILLYRALDLEPPTFAHIPLVHGPDGRRLAKRDRSIKLSTLRSHGANPGRLLALLAGSLGVPGVTDCPSHHELISRFNPSHIPRDPWIVAPDALPYLASPD